MIADVATDLLAAALAAWRDTGVADPGVQRVVVGDVALDDCCERLLIVSIDQLVWWNPFPFEALARGGGGVVIPFAPQGPCIGSLGAAATVWVGRCIPVLDNRGAAPEADDEQGAQVELVDLAQAVAGTLACLADAEDRWAIGGVSFLGTEGGCLVAQIAARLDRT